MECAESKPQVLLDFDDGIMDEILMEFAEEENHIIQLSDNDEIESLLSEFELSESDVDDEKKLIGSKILSDDDDDEMNDLLEEFREENDLNSDLVIVKQEGDTFDDDNENKSIMLCDSNTKNGTVYDSAVEILISNGNTQQPLNNLLNSVLDKNHLHPSPKTQICNSDISKTNCIKNSLNDSNKLDTDSKLKKDDVENKINSAFLGNNSIKNELNSDFKVNKLHEGNSKKIILCQNVCDMTIHIDHPNKIVTFSLNKINDNESCVADTKNIFYGSSDDAADLKVSGRHSLLQCSDKIINPVHDFMVNTALVSADIGKLDVENVQNCENNAVTETSSLEITTPEIGTLNVKKVQICERNAATEASSLEITTPEVGIKNVQNDENNAVTETSSLEITTPEVGTLDDKNVQNNENNVDANASALEIATSEIGPLNVKNALNCENNTVTKPLSLEAIQSGNSSQGAIKCSEISTVLSQTNKIDGNNLACDNLNVSEINAEKTEVCELQEKECNMSSMNVLMDSGVSESENQKKVSVNGLEVPHEDHNSITSAEIENHVSSEEEISNVSKNSIERGKCTSSEKITSDTLKRPAEAEKFVSSKSEPSDASKDTLKANNCNENFSNAFQNAVSTENCIFSEKSACDDIKSKSDNFVEEISCANNELPLNKTTEDKLKEHDSKTVTVENNVSLEKKSSDRIGDVELQDENFEEIAKYNGQKALKNGKRKLKTFSGDTERKKMKNENDMKSVDSNITSVVSASSVKEKVKKLLPWNPHEEIRVSEGVLKQLSSCILRNIFDEFYCDTISEASRTCTLLEAKLKDIREVSKSQQEEINRYRDVQKKMFGERNYKKIKTRTVGINVRILKLKGNHVEEVVKKDCNNITENLCEKEQVKEKPILKDVPVKTEDSKNDSCGKEMQRKAPLIPETKVSVNNSCEKNQQQEVSPLPSTEASENLSLKQTDGPKINSTPKVAPFVLPNLLPPNIIKNGTNMIPYLKPTKHALPPSQVQGPATEKPTATFKNVLLDSSNKMQLQKDSSCKIQPQKYGIAMRGHVKKDGAIGADILSKLPPDANIIIPFSEFAKILQPGTQGPIVLTVPAVTSQVTTTLPNVMKPVRCLVSQDPRIRTRSVPPPQMQRNKALRPRIQPAGSGVPMYIPSAIPRYPGVHLRPAVMQRVPNVSQFNRPQSQQGPVIAVNYPPPSVFQPTATVYNSVPRTNRLPVSMRQPSFSYSASSLSGNCISTSQSTASMRPPQRLMQYSSASLQPSVFLPNTMPAMLNTSQLHPSLPAPCQTVSYSYSVPRMNHPSLLASCPSTSHTSAVMSVNPPSLSTQIPDASQNCSKTTTNHSLFSEQHLPSSKPHAVAHKVPPWHHSISEDFLISLLPSLSSAKETAVPQSHLQNSTSTNDSSNCEQNIPPLPEEPCYPNSNRESVPPQPTLRAVVDDKGESVTLSWNLSLSEKHADVLRYEIYSCQIKDEISPVQWKETGSVKAMELPMACTLRNFEKAKSYHFILRAVDTFGHAGPFSKPATISISD